MSAVQKYVCPRPGTRLNVQRAVAAVKTMYPPVVCRMPLGFPVLPDVYSRNRGCSASTGWQARVPGWFGTTSCHQWSRPGRMATSFPTRRRTSTLRTPGNRSQALSTFAFSGTTAPLRHAPSHVTMTELSASCTRSTIACAAKPPKITLCGAPMRAHARTAIASSGTIPM
jgi:hypothetical protein